MGKIRVSETTSYIMEKDTGESFEVFMGDTVIIKLKSGQKIEGTVCYPPKVEPFTICVKNDKLGYVTIRWTLIDEIINTGHDDVIDKYKTSDWVHTR